MRIAGADGCKNGWVAVIIEPGGQMHAERIACIADLFDRPLTPDIVAVDMPMGLPDRIEAKGRAPERLVRSHLGARQSSVFSMPSRSAVYANIEQNIPEDERYRHACAVARATSAPPRAVAKQGFAIFPKIIEVDEWLRENPTLQPRVYECHPEVSFWAMNGQQPVGMAKKARGVPHTRPRPTTRLAGLCRLPV